MKSDNKCVYHRRYTQYNHITFLDDECVNTKRLYKYLDVESALSLFETGDMNYVDPTNWFDPFEKRFYEADYSALQFEKPKVFCSCFTKKSTNEAAWVMYSYFKKGLAARSVRLEIDPFVYYDLLEDYGKLTGKHIYIGNVNYSLSEKTIKALHKLSSKHHHKYFCNFCIEKFIKLLLVKRKAFEYEQEIRVFVVCQLKEKDICSQCLNKSITMRYDLTLLSTLIKSIVISPDCTQLEYDIISREIKRCTEGYIKCSQSKLYRSFDSDKIQIER